MTHTHRKPYKKELDGGNRSETKSNDTYTRTARVSSNKDHEDERDYGRTHSVSNVLEFTLFQKPGFNIIARSRKVSQGVAVNRFRNKSDQVCLRLSTITWKQAKICLRLLATPCNSLEWLSQAVAEMEHFSISATHYDSLRFVVIHLFVHFKLSPGTLIILPMRRY